MGHVHIAVFKMDRASLGDSVKSPPSSAGERGLISV